MTEASKKRTKTAMIWLIVGLALVWYFKLHLAVLNLPRELAQEDLDRLECTAEFSRMGTLTLKTYNGSDWDIERITVGISVRNVGTGSGWPGIERVLSQDFQKPFPSLSNRSISFDTGYTPPDYLAPMPLWSWELVSAIGTRR